MGYTTQFSGVFRTDRPMTDAHRAYLTKLAQTRRVKRDATKTATRADPSREAVGLPVGDEGGYFVGAGGHYGQEHPREHPEASDILGYNDPPSGQPGLWCQWEPDEDDPCVIGWNDGEKFYHYVEWLRYLIEHFLAPWGYRLNGVVNWQGEDTGDVGTMRVEDNNVVVEKVTLPAPTR